MKPGNTRGLAQQLPFVVRMTLIFVLACTVQIHSASVYVAMCAAFCICTVLWSRLCIRAVSARHNLSPVSSAICLTCQVGGLCLLAAAVMFAHFQESELAATKSHGRLGVYIRG